ncbi:DASH family cryptochrome [Aurantivibrio plasticivorans]
MYDTSLYWFTRDLRLDDNNALQTAALTSKKLLCVYVVDLQWFSPNAYASSSMGESRRRFLAESLQDLSEQLSGMGQQLLVFHGKPVDVLKKLIRTYHVGAVFRSELAGVYEARQWQELQRQAENVQFRSFSTHTLFTQQDLPFKLSRLPQTFTQFRKLVENRKVLPARDKARCVPGPPLVPLHNIEHALRQIDPSYGEKRHSSAMFTGGERAALTHLRGYFSSPAPSTYKETRNALEGFSASSKFSPWLAQGCVSPRRVLSVLREFENDVVANESTHWLYFELLWREYFQWYACAHKQDLFRFQGITGKPGRRCFYPERYQRWANGNTPYPLVNACMRQLNATGYMSNRGRQIVASCLIHELDLDWRWGAAYFEQQLVDYDVASNWGNWQYLAGVGADPRGSRHFDIEKQTAQYDPRGEFIAKWEGDQHQTHLDSVDAADWPIMRP